MPSALQRPGRPAVLFLSYSSLISSPRPLSSCSLFPVSRVSSSSRLCLSLFPSRFLVMFAASALIRNERRPLASLSMETSFSPASHPSPSFRWSRLFRFSCPTLYALPVLARLRRQPGGRVDQRAGLSCRRPLSRLSSPLLGLLLLQPVLTFSFLLFQECRRGCTEPIM